MEVLKFYVLASDKVIMIFLEKSLRFSTSAIKWVMSGGGVIICRRDHVFSSVILNEVNVHMRITLKVL